MSLKEDLHRLVDELPESELLTARRVLLALRVLGSDPLLDAFLVAPVDDEPTTPDEDEGAAAAWQEYQRGEAISADEAKRILLA